MNHIWHNKGFDCAEFLSPNSSNPNRLNLFFTMESPMTDNNLHGKCPQDFFNVTMTVRKDSTIWYPYDKFENIDNKTKNNEIWTEKEVETAIGRKSKLALQYVTHCITDSRRETYLTKLLKHANITVYGDCNNNPCKNNTCYEGEIGNFNQLTNFKIQHFSKSLFLFSL